MLAEREVWTEIADDLDRASSLADFFERRNRERAEVIRADLRAAEQLRAAEERGELYCRLLGAALVALVVLLIVRDLAF